MSIEKKEVDIYLKRRSIVDRVVDHVCTPIYQPTNQQWEVTFKTLGWDRSTIDDFWAVFCRINKSRTGEITIFEFLNYFDLDRSEHSYIDKCFEYFDTTGGGSVDFLEFIVSVWNICTMKVDTLTNFTFDIYDLDSDGQLSLPEIERMVLELYGKNKILSKIGHEVLQDINQFAEERGGILTLTSFTIYTMNHSLLLFPIFRIQRTIQKKIMGLKYWNNVGNGRMSHFNQKKEFNPRHVQILLRTYKTGAAAAFLTHTGDPNVALREHFIKEQEEQQKEEQEEVEEGVDDNGNLALADNRRETYKYQKLKRAVEKVQEIKATKTVALKESAQSIRKKTVDMATQAFIEAGKRAKTSYSKSRLSKIPSSLNTFVNDMRERLGEPEYNSKPGLHDNQIAKVATTTNEVSIGNGVKPQQHESSGAVNSTTLKKPTNKTYTRRSRKKKLTPRSIPKNDSIKRNTVVTSKSSKKFDHRIDNQFQKPLRPRTPGAIVYTVDQDGDFSRKELNT